MLVETTQPTPGWELRPPAIFGTLRRLNDVVTDVVGSQDVTVCAVWMFETPVILAKVVHSNVVYSMTSFESHSARFFSPPPSSKLRITAQTCLFDTLPSSYAILYTAPIAPHLGFPQVRGEVQGVNFRAWTAKQAGQLNVTGWVSNTSDGHVKGEALGDKASVDKLCALRSIPVRQVMALMTRYLEQRRAVGPGPEHCKCDRR